MFLTLTPDPNFKNSGKQIDQVDFLSSVQSGLLLQPNTKIALHSGSWDVLEGFTIPNTTYSVSVMGHNFIINVLGQVFKEAPAGSSDTAGKQVADYLNSVWKTAFTQGVGLVMSDGTNDNNTLTPAWRRFGNDQGTSNSTGWEWDDSGKDMVFECKYNHDADYDTHSNVTLSSQTSRTQNFTKTNSYVNINTINTNNGDGTFTYKMSVSKSVDQWEDNLFIPRDYTFVCDGVANAGKGQFGEMIFKWKDTGNNKVLVGFSTNGYTSSLGASSNFIKGALLLETGSVPQIRETKKDGSNTTLTFSTPPDAVANNDMYKIRMASNDTTAQTFSYYRSIDDGVNWVELEITPGQNRYESFEMDVVGEEIMPFFKGFNGNSDYRIQNWTCHILPTRAFYSGNGYNYKFSNYPNVVAFNPNGLSDIFDMKSSSGDTGGTKSDGGVINTNNIIESGVYVNIPTLGIKSITSGVERNVIGILPIGELGSGDNGLASINGLQFNQVYNMIYHDVNNQQEREHNQLRVQLMDKNGNLLLNLQNASITLCVKPSST